MPDTSTVQGRIHAVETGLLPKVVMKGAVHRMSLVQRMRVHDLPAFGMALINKGKIEWARTYGVLVKGGRVRANRKTLFQPGSVSKPVVAVAVLQLVEAGKLDLDTDVNRYLKRWKVPALAGEKPVTLRRLLSHTAGLNSPEQQAYAFGTQGYDPGEPVPTTVQLLRGEKPAINMPVARVPGLLGSFSYSGGGFVVLQLLLEDVTGLGFDTLLRKRVFEPAGMTRSTFAQPLPKKLWGNTARAHDDEGKLLRGGWSWVPEKAAGGLWSTPMDLAKFLLQISDAYLGKTGRILSPKMARLMLTPVDAVDPQRSRHIGLGMFMKRRGKQLVFMHSGRNPGMSSIMVMCPRSGQGYVYMQNRDEAGHLAHEVHRGVTAVYNLKGLLARRPQELEPFVVDTPTLATYAGKYTLKLPKRTMAVSVRVYRGKLYATFGKDPEVRLRPFSKVGFMRVRKLALLTFETGKTGRVTGFSMNRGGRHKARRVSPQP